MRKDKDSDLATSVRLAKGSAILVDDAGLAPINARPQFKHYVVDIWKRRHFIWADSKGRQATRHQDLLLGRIWDVINPLLNAGVYGVLFGVLLKTSHGIQNFIGYLVLGVVFFGFISHGLTAAGSVVRGSKSLITSFNFPIASVVIAAGTRHFMESIVPGLVSIIFALGFQIDKGLSWTIILVFPLYVLIHIFSTGVMLFVARLTAFLPDLKSLLVVVNRAWFYCSGVFFELSRFTSNEVLIYIFHLNPAFLFLSAIRDCVLYQTIPSIDVWGYLMVVSFLTFGFGLIFFWQAEDRYVGVK
ncbi:ABC transporter permease [Corynebacterium glutamicum]|uniref:ABC transporter permease n=1 Tax=Corynebacterium glutamicum TaxID=1718 RepID=UPI000A8E1149|nr:ABC transporter permease [Corynebacterium glutamicum]QDX74614.1 hypothetical protein AKL15_02005 [Corynebacterium glutamicum]QDX77376.1 hypothetical protein AKL16_02010 [Corynebacterium glutamicum]TWS34498.1 hypothetical protein AKJ19_08345 [Corynebacterium glutamicum]TWS38052.1 hypothetical protein AKJ20_00340 [Corynebacterium glutamicum]TWS44886.1 hypothetical protein AKJ24_02385 [Corynebacterium glutamicum]